MIWVLDAPVSNSGKLKGICYELAEKRRLSWDVRLENAPDKYLIDSKELIASSDAWVLDECKTWFNLGAWLIGDTPGVKLFTNPSAAPQRKIGQRRR